MRTAPNPRFLLGIKENWLSGAADRAQQARRGYGFQESRVFLKHYAADCMPSF